MDTFLVRTLLVPSTVSLLGRWNWWPGRVEAGMGFPGDSGTASSEGDGRGAESLAVAAEAAPTDS